MILTIERRGLIDDTMGAAFVGVVCAAFLHGVSCLQGWYYFVNQRDGWSIRLLVGLVLFFDTVHQALITHTVYYYLISEYGNPAALTRLIWSLIAEVIFNGLTAFLVQCFLTMRVWRLSNRNIPLTMVALSLVFSEFACVIAYTFIAMKFKNYVQLETLKPLSITVNALAAAGDVLIAGSLCWMLHRSRTGFLRSDTMINKLIMFAVNTGLLTSVCAVASLISITVAPDTFYYIGFFFCIGRLYSNSLLATLNARQMIRQVADGVHTSSCGNGHLSLKETPCIKNNAAAISQAGNIAIKIDTTKEFTTDGTSDRSSKGASFPFKHNNLGDD